MVKAAAAVLLQCVLLGAVHDGRCMSSVAGIWGGDSGRRSRSPASKLFTGMMQTINAVDIAAMGNTT